MLKPKRFICSRSIAWCLLSAGVIFAGKVCADQTYDQTNPSAVWDTTTQNWDGSTAAWNNSGTTNAIFTGTSELVDVNAAINVGNITFNSGNWNIGDFNAPSGSLNFAAPSTITVTNAADTDTISAPIASGSLTMAGNGTLVLSGANTFTGNVIVNAGNLKITSNTALGDTTGTTTVTGGAALILGNGVNVVGETVGLNGAGGNNAGTLQADAGATATWGGTINIGSSGARVGAQSGGTLNITGVIQNDPGGSNGNLAIGEIPGASTPGVVIISGTSNTYTGQTQIVRGVLKLGANNALPATTLVDVSSSTTATEDSVFDLNGFSQNVAGIQRTNTTGAGIITNNGATPSTLTVTDNGGHTYSGVIRDGTSTVALTKAGTATLTLSGANTYSGATTVSAGILNLSGSLANTPITVSGGSFTETSTGVISGTSSLAASANVSLAGANTYTGATTISAGVFTLTGSLAGTAITTSGGSTGGQLNETSTGVISGAIGINVNSGVFNSGSSSFTAGATLGGANTFTGAVVVNSSGVLYVTNNLGLGSGTATITVGSGEVVLGSGITVTGRNITINGNGTNNNGALQSAPNSTATWAGNILANSATRIGGGDGGTLIINGVISGGASNTILFNRGANAVTILNAVNTYTGDTQLFANTGTGGATLKIGVDNAINSASRLTSISTAVSTTTTLDLNGHILTLRGMDTTSLPGGAQFITVANNATGTTSTLSVGDTNSLPAATETFGGIVKDGASGAGGMSLVKINANIQILTANNTYTGSTTVNGGTLQIGAAGAGNTAGTLASTSFVLNGGTFSLNNVGAANNNTNRLSDSANFSLRGGSFSFLGSDQTSTNSSETIGSFSFDANISGITVKAGSTNSAVLTVNQLSHTANSGIGFVNGLNLGSNSSSAVRIMVTTAPTLIGGTDGAGTGINASVQNTKIVPYLLGEAGSASGGTGTISGTPNTFVTWSASGGLRPLNLTDEFTQNAFVAGNNIHLTAATNLTTSTSINSLIVDLGSTTNVTDTITSGQTLTVASGAILFSSGNGITISGGTIAFGAAEGIVTDVAPGVTIIGSTITGTAGVSYSVATGSTLALGGGSTYTGNTLLAGGIVVPQTNSTGPAGAPTTGPFGQGTVIFGGSSLRATTSAPITIGNAISFNADTTIVSGGTDKTLTFTGPVTLTGNRTLTQNSTATTTFSGAISDGGNGFGLTVAGTGTAPLVLSGVNTYTGPTVVKGSTLVVSGSISGSSVLVGNSTSASASAILGGSGTVGNVTVGAIANDTGAVLMPHAGSSSTSAGTTFHAGSVTFANSGTHLSLEIGRTSAYNGLVETGALGGDVSDHLATSGTLSLNGADLQLSLLTTTGYTPVNGDLFFLTINSGGAISGTFSSLNGTATNLSEGSIFTLNSQSYEITYQANYATNSFTGGNDIALEAVIPEPGTLISLFGGLGCLVGAQRFRRSWGGKAKD